MAEATVAAWMGVRVGRGRDHHVGQPQRWQPPLHLVSDRRHAWLPPARVGPRAFKASSWKGRGVPPSGPLPSSRVAAYFAPQLSEDAFFPFGNAALRLVDRGDRRSPRAPPRLRRRSGAPKGISALDTVWTRTAAIHRSRLRHPVVMAETMALRCPGCRQHLRGAAAAPGLDRVKPRRKPAGQIANPTVSMLIVADIFPRPSSGSTSRKKILPQERASDANSMTRAARRPQAATMHQAGAVWRERTVSIIGVHHQGQDEKPEKAIRIAIARRSSPRLPLWGRYGACPPITRSDSLTSPIAGRGSRSAFFYDRGMKARCGICEQPRGLETSLIHLSTVCGPRTRRGDAPNRASHRRGKQGPICLDRQPRPRPFPSIAWWPVANELKVPMKSSISGRSPCRPPRPATAWAIRHAAAAEPELSTVVVDRMKR